MGLPQIKSAEMASLPKIAHIFTTRRGGVSTQAYASLNCSRFSGDRSECIQENHRRILEAIGSQKLVSLKQVHGNVVRTIDQSWTGSETVAGDGLASRESGVALGVMGADCAPVLFADSKNRVVGAAHAGWKGALSGITDKVIARMCELGAERDWIVAAIGPAIQQLSYEVGQEFKNHFVAASGAGCKKFFCWQSGQVHFDLPGYIEDRLASQGITLIDCLRHDTFSMEQEFFSYRRACKHGEKNCGRQTGAISLIG